MAITAAELLALLDKFDFEAYHESLTGSLGKAFGEIVAIQGTVGAKRAGGEFDADDPFVKKQLTSYVGERIVSLDDTTKADVASLIRNILDEGSDLSPAAIGDAIVERVREKFDGYTDWRADRIARSETAIAYNFGNALGYKQAGVEKVRVIDGDDDEDCRKANGQIWTLEEALANPIAHPNCERDFAPIVEE